MIFLTAINSINQEHLVYPVTADTTSISSGNDTGIDTRQAAYFHQAVGYHIHVFECQFQENEILLSHEIKYIEGKPTAPNGISPESVYIFIKLFKPNKVGKMDGELHPNLPVTRRAVNSLYNGFVMTRVMVSRSKGISILSLFSCFMFI